MRNVLSVGVVTEISKTSVMPYPHLILEQHLHSKIHLQGTHLNIHILPII